MDDVTTDAVGLLPIEKISEKLGLSDQDLDPYGRYTAKINRLPPADAPGNGNLILVTGITPTGASPPPQIPNYKLARSFDYPAHPRWLIGHTAKARGVKDIGTAVHSR